MRARGLRLAPTSLSPSISCLARSVATLALAAFVASCSAPQPKTAATPAVAATTPPATTVARVEPPPFAYETFDAVWSEIDRGHFDPNHNGVDWVAVREEFRPRVADVRTDDELRALLDEMIGRLGQSHFAIIPKSAMGVVAASDASDGSAGGANATDATSGASASQTTASAAESEPSHAGGDVGVTLRLVGGEVVAMAPEPDGAAARAGVRAGWKLTEVNGNPVRVPEADAASDPMVRFHLAAAVARAADCDVGEEVRLTFEDGDGVTREVELVGVDPGGQTVRFGNLPPMVTTVRSHPIGSAELAQAGIADESGSEAPRIGYIAFNVWMVPAAPKLDEAIDRFRNADGIVLDLRGNPGGVGGMAMGLGGHFLTEPLSLGAMTTRDGRLEFRVNPRRSSPSGQPVEPFAGPVAILIDPLSASTSEIFAAGLQELGRAVVFGERSAGAALPSIVVSLPNGDVLQYAIADFITPDGNPIEGRGVEPDVPVTLTRETLAREDDPVLCAALRWIAEESARRRAPHA